MERPPSQSDPNALTQPIPVVPVTPPPPRAPAQPMASQSDYAASGATAGRTFAGGATTGSAPASGAIVAPAAAERYVHRFGSIPFYLFARFAAFAVDIFGVGFVLATFGFHATDIGYFMVAGHDANGYATLAGLSLGIALIFAFLCESLFGTTLGKSVFALRVRRANGSHAGAGRIFIRYLLRPIDLIVIGPLLALITPRHQRLGDLAVGTVVARSRLGAFSTVIGLGLMLLVAYAQIAYGGGITSAIGVSAETANYAPALVGRATAAFNVPVLHPATSIAPQVQSTDAGSTPAPIASGETQ